MKIQTKELATENTEGTEMSCGNSTLRGCRIDIRDFSVTSVFSDMTTSHSTRLPNNASQVDGYVAKRFF